MTFKCEPGCALCCKASPVTVLPHEVYILQKYAEKLGVGVVFTPAYKVVDLKSGVRIALSYLMHLDESGACPFLNGTRCMIHDLYKPLTCRSFPYLPKVIRYELNPAAREVHIDVKFVMSTLCPVVRRDLTAADVAKMSSVKIAVKYAPREVEVAVKTLEKRYLYAKILSELWRRGDVELDEEGRHPFYPVINGFAFIRRFYPELTLDKLL
ncbi:YkgJ family cysteine cluster protein [Pyrobaculum aerophilum]|uniref:YkgJ family cysteine cluster protein n=1 Tax=Pyrobaculum aerophilum TaxID=13773 RepID=A0A832T2L1_9CREN|nr:MULTISPECIES: YkgJ family cysteine cluster protein [Pyrobaculum]MCX8137070.1 YkgJ family cysteine cluster protein [Pyrobaculum aerophilum]HII48097.1 YkgJ family cysteine cluster protein [Pyrobaculum aerophilum]